MKTAIAQSTPDRPLDVPPILPNPPAAAQVMPTPYVYIAEIPKWEYKRILRNLTQVETLTEDELTILGAEGWELTGTIYDRTVIYFYFKRPAR